MRMNLLQSEQILQYLFESIIVLVRMQLYNLSLQPSTAIIKSLSGSFTAAKAQQILLAKTKSLQLYSINQQGKLQLIRIEQLFCIIRTVVTLRYSGTSKDLIIVGSDSGKVVILEFDQHRRRFAKTHEETFGKTGCRRIVPGQYIAVDPRGRAFMIAAIQKQKFVYTLNRQNEKLSISSPRQAHKSHTLCISLAALDIGNQNCAQFAALQIDYGEIDDKQALINTGQIKKVIAYYEMDFGMNTVIRKKEVSVDVTAHLLIPVPNFPQGPGGLIAILEDYLIYYRTFTEFELIKFPLYSKRPQNRKTQFTSYTTYRQKGNFFILISSELGDIFKVQFMMKTNQKQQKQVQSIKIEYYDTTSCLVSMSLTKNGYLFCASEKQDHVLYTVISKQITGKTYYTHSQMANNTLVQFERKGQKQRELAISDTIEQYGPTTDLKVADLKGDNNPQIYMINASGNNGKNYLRVIKQGLKVRDLNTQKFPKFIEIWSIRGQKNQSNDHEYQKNIVISMVDKTIILSVVGNGFAQTKDTGIDEQSQTLFINRMQDGSLIQITSWGFRHIPKAKGETVKTVKFDGKIIKGVAKGMQMVIAMYGGEIFYYELDQTGTLRECSTQTSLDSEVVSLDLSPVGQGKKRSKFMVAAFKDFTTRIFELQGERMQILSTQNMKSEIQSILIEEMETNQDQSQRFRTQLYLYTGLANGMLFRTSVDTISGKQTDTRTKYLGSKPVKCIRLRILNKPAILALSSRPWLIYNYGNKYMTTLLSFPYLESACSLRVAKFPHSILGYCEGALKVLNLESFGNIFHSQKLELDYSAKKMMVFKNKIAIIESDQIQNNGQFNTQQQSTIMINKQEITQRKINSGHLQKNAKRRWVSQIRIYNPESTFENKLIIKIPFDQNQTCVSMCCFQDEAKTENTNECYLVFGCVKGLNYHPKLQMQQASLKVYLWKNDTLSVSLMYKTEVEDIPMVMCVWKKKILVGIGNCLRAYEIGKKKLLRKAQLKNLNSPINTIRTMGERIYTTEVADSFHLYKYKEKQQTFYEIADDVLPRYVTATAILDYHTVIGADKFENIFISRVPQNAEEDVDGNPNSYKFRWQNGYLNGAPFKMQQEASFYVGQIATAIEKSSLANTGSQIIIYSTINGGIAALCPFQTREDVDFFTHLEMYLRNLTPNLGGREHLAYRSYYSPCKSIVDGDLCEVYNKLTYQQQVNIGKALDRTPQQIQKKLQQMRNRLI